MNSLALRKIAIDRELAAKYVAMPVVGRLRPARLRRKGPMLWAAFALLVLAADFLLALLAWLAVDLVMS